jgi:LPS-assembly lipoprotein
MRFARGLALVAALSLTGCGFRPLYGEASFPEGTQAVFASVQIEPIGPTNDSERIGFVLSNALDEALHPPGVKAAAAYVLKTSLSDERRGLGIQDDASITRYNYRLTAEWTLTRSGEEKPFANGRAETTASYNVVDQQYATLVARRDAEERAAQEIAEQMKLKIAVALSAPQ